MAYSFYGGKSGSSLEIKAHFDSVFDLVKAFNKGGGYTEVNYGEYAIIDCPDRTSAENGILYRRGFDYENPCVLLDTASTFRQTYPSVEYQRVDFGDTGENTYIIEKTGQEQAFLDYVHNPGGGAEYIAQIAGPEGQQGKPGSLQYFGSLDNLATLKTQYPQGLTGDSRGQLVTVTINGVPFVYGFDYTKNDWINLGSISVEGAEPASSVVASKATPVSLNSNGIWFVISE